MAERAVTPDHDVRGVLAIAPFRRLWTALSLSSLGDWLGLLALTALAPRLASGGYAAANLAVAGVFILRLAPAIIVGPIAGVVADRLDRRLTMVVCDVARFLLFLSIPAVHTLWWLFVATALIEVASLVWIPAKEASVPNLVPRERLEAANQLSLFTTYGSAPVAAAVFAGLALLTGILDNAMPSLAAVDLALYVDAATFLVSALTILRLTEIPGRAARVAGEPRPSVWSTLVEGWTFVGRNRLVRGLVVGMLGAFAAGGAVIGLARTFVLDLGGGDPGYGLLFGTVFVGLAAGMLLGPRLLPDLSRRRLFGLAIGGAGLALALLGLLPNLVLAVGLALVIGAFAGVAWVTGYTLLGLEVADELRGRTFAFVQTMVRVVLVAVLAASPLLAAAIGEHRLRFTDAMSLTYNGAAAVFLVAGLLAAALGSASFRAMDDRHGVGIGSDLAAAFHSAPVGRPGPANRQGFFIALEGGEGVGKSTQARALADWLESLGHEVLVTHEPGGTEVGRRLRSALLDLPVVTGVDPSGAPQPTGPSPRAEALMFAADRAEHVATVIRPALDLGHVVVCDRYIDSSVAYQGAGRDLVGAEVARLSRWATDGLTPQLTVLLDLPPGTGLARVGTPDRLESEPVAFHTRVRDRFLDLARRGGARYLVVDAGQAAEVITAAITERLVTVLPPSAQQVREAEELRAAEEERQRAEADLRRQAEEAARLAAEDGVKAEAAAAEQRLQLAAAEAAARAAADETARVEAARVAGAARDAAAQAAATRAAARAETRSVPISGPSTASGPSPTRDLRSQPANAGQGQQSTDLTTELPVVTQSPGRRAQAKPQGQPRAEPDDDGPSLTDELFGGLDDRPGR